MLLPHSLNETEKKNKVSYLKKKKVQQVNSRVEGVKMSGVIKR